MGHWGPSWSLFDVVAMIKKNQCPREFGGISTPIIVTVKKIKFQSFQQQVVLSTG